MIRNCFIDLDGTLLNHKKEITKENEVAINKALSLGKRIFIATGRPVEGVYPIVKSLGLVKDNDYFIAYNGAVIYKANPLERVKVETLTGADLKKIYQFAKDNNCFIHAFLKDGSLISPKKNEFTEMEERLSQLEVRIVDFNQVKDDEEIIKILLVEKKEILDKAEENIKEEDKKAYQIVRSAGIFLEFLSPKANKGFAMEWILKQINSTLEETMAIGDGGNDLKMIELAKVGVAMENAFLYVKEKADYITSDLDNSGVAKAINKFLI